MEQAARTTGPRAASAWLDAKLALWSLFLSLLLLAGCDGPRDVAVATVNGAAVLESEVGIELRSTLWRRGEAWMNLDGALKQARRKEALDRCIEQKLLERWAARPATLPAAQVQASEDAFQQFLKQFEPPEGWKPRLEMQGVTEVQVRERITDEVWQGNAIEIWLKTQRTQSPEQTESSARTWFDRPPGAIPDTGTRQGLPSFSHGPRPGETGSQRRDRRTLPEADCGRSHAGVARGQVLRG